MVRLHHIIFHASCSQECTFTGLWQLQLVRQVALCSSPVHISVGVAASTIVYEATRDVSYAIIVGGSPRKGGMGRKEAMHVRIVPLHAS